MASDPLEHGPLRYVEEEVESHVPVCSQDRDRREESSQSAIGRAQQAFLK